MFSTFGGFFAAYIPLVILAIIGIIKEDKLIEFEQKLKTKMRAVFALKSETKAKQAKKEVQKDVL